MKEKIPRVSAGKILKSQLHDELATLACCAKPWQHIWSFGNLLAIATTILQRGFLICPHHKKPSYGAKTKCNNISLHMASLFPMDAGKYRESHTGGNAHYKALNYSCNAYSLTTII